MMHRTAGRLVLGFFLGWVGIASAASSDWWPIQPKLKWLYASSGVYLDRWGGGGQDGNGFSWHAKDRYLNPPQTLSSLSLGGALALSPKLGLSLSIPAFYNTFDEYRAKNGTLHQGAHRYGVGDFEIGLPIKLGGLSLQPQVAIPGLYAKEYLTPWTGFGVYRGSLGIGYGRGPHYVWAAGEEVLYKPRGQDSGLVENGDFALKGGYAWKLKLNAKFQTKLGTDLAYTHFTWQPGTHAQTTFSADPKLSLAVSPFHGQEISFTASATAFSTQGGERAFRSYASRRIFLGVYWGRYF